ncbi:hypothetical protein PN465_20755 [Nodularia spumigena CS-584]|jgi:hypothetical protein|uniref:Uncharacterized protein n=1 Tax=Nodularia spumigena UHCC 0039 TaxID=1914872 RepID=A0A2S0QA83_NODSP|nr:hypothetical protein [Nodularia spumigena]AVZ31323.1 hypothetical protein BMF81_03945 [Nodularia spumigena UHCC 0039]EAW44959.1 hypothetical protein N9414_03256 [Nodularia spumigena CCY9414]MDB9384623.1 hypothetical protein [Nodularia spumigena CS-584]
MNESTFTIFIVFGFIWIVMATVSVIALLKADGQKIRFGKTGLIVIIPIIVPIIFTLVYAAFRGTF